MCRDCVRRERPLLRRRTRAELAGEAHGLPATRTTRRELLARAGRAGLGLAVAAPLAGWLAGCSTTTASTVSAGAAPNPRDAVPLRAEPHQFAEYPSALWVPSPNYGYPDQGDHWRMGFPAAVRT